MNNSVNEALINEIVRNSTLQRGLVSFSTLLINNCHNRTQEKNSFDIFTRVSHSPQTIPITSTAIL